MPIALGLASVILPLLGGWLADRGGRRPIMIWPRLIIAIVAIPAFLWLREHPTAGPLYVVTFLMSALSSINAAAIIVAIPEGLPREVRSAGLSIVYALSVSIFGGSTIYIVNKLIASTRPISWYRPIIWSRSASSARSPRSCCLKRRAVACKASPTQPVECVRRLYTLCARFA